ncbi:carboxymuconolactone decarboxylase family protein [Solimonas sp. K1W22B-7]|uniref:carboxymuconolactone decarboxylase family protein n=1 Tax=Solimonas sp. K1W22B-7 TaxID=2303331 RepID=UPI000E3366D7|nr:carboxymuconolactone decarboxylase family protein [Solimonas sp. K1W22B-7]AXQ28717.1 carboxymuconolactone decarboxylase family protein [Solimonas sp. K1W22B-7]
MSRYDRKKGVEVFNEVYCGKVPLPAEEGQSPFLDYMLETLFGTLWADETLSIRDRRLLLIGAIAAQGDPTTLTIQLRSALLRGELTPAQLDAVAVFLTQYVGYPKGSQLFTVCNSVKAEAPQK